SNSVVYAQNGGAIGVGAGGQSRIHCTRLAGGKADNWYLRRHEKTLKLPFLPNLPRPVRDNAVDAYISADYADEALAPGVWETLFTKKPEPLTADEKAAWLKTQTDVCLGSDAFFPFGDNIERAAKSGVRYIAQPGGSVRDDNVIAAANKHGMVMYFTGLRLFHH
ncbi:MAG: phosphoribosylaminoimidazolecarboxamide formyltransferase, partial [Oscillospiraceae bacterium]|nr:phosphoribosylaminoimidazolecarboxamide formyltransferase [Oscillospiraceae bacterium]